MTARRLERWDKDEPVRKRLERVNIADSLPPSVTLFEDLERFLNETKTSAGRKVVKILEQMLEIERMASPLEGIVWVLPSLKETDPKKFDLLDEISKKTYFLQKELSRFRFIPHAEVVTGGNHGPSEWVAYWRWSNKKFEKHIRMDAGEALQMILKFTQIGYLTRLRHCAQCKKWLYARFRHQTSCSVECRQKRYTQTEAFKVHRREYSRRYYHNQIKNPFRRKRVNK